MNYWVLTQTLDTLVIIKIHIHIYVIYYENTYKSLSKGHKHTKELREETFSEKVSWTESEWAQGQCGT